MKMKPTDVLIKEHEAILLMLQILEAVSNRLENGRDVKPEHLPQIVEFFRVFADKCHHGKEENLLFKAMIKAGLPEKNGPVAVMLREHETGRDFVGKMDTAAAAYAGGDRTQVDRFIHNARRYIALLSQHIQKENRILFPMADRLIPPEEQSRLSAGFNKIETEIIGEGIHERFHELLHALKSEYLMSANEKI